jgi:type VI secretion system protein ImpC
MDRRERARVDLDISVGRDSGPAAPQPDDAFCIAVIGDFSGRAHAEGQAQQPALENRKPVLVDRDNIDEVIAAYAPRLQLPATDRMSVDLEFRSLDDFHPDQIYRRDPFFQRLAGIARIDVPAPPRQAPLPKIDPQELLSSSMIDRMVAEQTGTSEDPLAAYLRTVASNYALPQEDPREAATRDRIYAAATEAMRRIMHHPAFRAVEALWRGIDFLVRRADTDASLRIYLVDATRAEVEAEPIKLAKLLDRGALALPGGAWSVIAADWSFAPDGAVFLAQLGEIAQHLGAPILAAADPRLAGVTSFDRLPDDIEESNDNAWHNLRHSPTASLLGLALPRFLLRLPYGRDADPCETFPFEEMTSPPAHEDYLWGNAAFACTELLAESFTAAGWSMRPGIRLEIDGLPLHTYRAEGSSELKPCAESIMSDRIAGELMDAGLMALATIKHGDTVRLVRFQSIASPLTALQGPWSRVD